MSGRLAGKVCLITGAAQGIGRATVDVFIREGAKVIAIDINADKLKNLNGMQGIMMTRVLDVRDRDGIFKLASEVQKIDVLFNCAGYVLQGTILDNTPEEWDFSFDVNVKSMFHFIQAFLPKMLEKKKGSIINMASCASSVRGIPQRTIYGATKAAVIGLTKGVARDYIQQGIRCNAICPGVVESESLTMRGQNSQDSDMELINHIKTNLNGRLQTTEEVANLCLYLASDESSYHTGNVILSEGGFTL